MRASMIHSHLLTQLSSCFGKRKTELTASISTLDAIDGELDDILELVSSEGSMSIYAKQAALLESLGKWEKLVEGVGGCKRKHEGDGEDDGESEGEGEEDSSGVSSSPAASRPKTAHPDDLEDT